MAKKGQTYFCEVCRQKIGVEEGGFGVLVCCGQEMKRVEAGGMMETWTSVHHKPVQGTSFVCKVCGQKINVINQTAGILECCGQRMNKL
jgi:desulfoferrodoxin-like iron-binding protein